MVRTNDITKKTRWKKPGKFIC